MIKKISLGLSARTKNGLIGLAIVVISLVAVAFLKATKPVPVPIEVKQRIWPVRVMAVTLENVYPEQVLYGTVESNKSVTIASPVSGEVGLVTVQDGSHIVLGQKLLALSKEDLEIPVQIAKADVIDAQAQLKLQSLAFSSFQKNLKYEKALLTLKRKDLNRNKQLVKKKLASASVVDKVKELVVRQELAVINAELQVSENKLKVSQLTSRLAKSKANFNKVDLNAERGVVIAPFDGRVSAVDVSVGDTVSTGTPLLSYYSLDSLELKAKIPKSKVLGVYQAVQSGKTLFATFTEGKKVYVLPLNRLSARSSASGLNAYFSLPESLQVLRPGDLAKIRLKGPKIEMASRLPFSALYGSNKIYLAVDGVLQSRLIQVLGEVYQDGQNWVLVKGALKEGESVVLTHLPNAISGLHISVVGK